MTGRPREEGVRVSGPMAAAYVQAHPDQPFAWARSQPATKWARFAAPFCTRLLCPRCNARWPIGNKSAAKMGRIGLFLTLDLPGVAGLLYRRAIVRRSLRGSCESFFCVATFHLRKAGSSIIARAGQFKMRLERKMSRRHMGLQTFGQRSFGSLHRF